MSEEDKQKYLSQRIELIPAGRGVSELRQQFSEPLFILMCIVVFVLLIACANIANLLVARALARRREMAVRMALGAGRPRLIRQLLTESTLLAALGALFGLLLAYWLRDLIIVIISKTYPWTSLDIPPDWRVLAFTAALSVLTSLLFGLAPAFRATEVAWGSSQLRAGFHSQRRAWLGKSLVVVQVALSLMLLAGAALFILTLRNLQELNPGFARDRILIFGLSPPESVYKDLRLADLYGRILEKLTEIPGVRSASLSDITPIDRGRSIELVNVEGFTPRSPQDQDVHPYTVSPCYFRTLGIPMLLGRDFRADDTGPRVVVVNNTFARFYYPGENPIGRKLRFPIRGRGEWREIVGVVGDTRHGTLRAPVARIVYLPYTSEPKYLGAMNFELRTDGDPSSLIGEVARQIEAVDRSLKPSNVRTLAAQIHDSLTEERLIAMLSSGFAATALLLASIGLFGVMSYAVTRRTAEIGIRMALGATRRSILGMVLRESLFLILAGLLIGIPVALATARLISNRLFGLRHSDPLTIAGAALLMISVGVLASYLPARRASCVDPVIALRCE